MKNTTHLTPRRHKKFLIELYGLISSNFRKWNLNYTKQKGKKNLNVTHAAVSDYYLDA